MGTEYTFGNGSVISFIGLDKDDVGKGLRCDILYINEANKTSYVKCMSLDFEGKKANILTITRTLFFGLMNILRVEKTLI